MRRRFGGKAVLAGDFFALIYTALSFSVGVLAFQMLSYLGRADEVAFADVDAVLT